MRVHVRSSRGIPASLLVGVSAGRKVTTECQRRNFSARKASGTAGMYVRHIKSSPKAVYNAPSRLGKKSYMMAQIDKSNKSTFVKPGMILGKNNSRHSIEIFK